MENVIGYSMVILSVAVAIIISELVKRASRFEREHRLPHRHGWDIDEETGATAYCKCGASMPNPYHQKQFNPVTRMPEEKN